MPPCRLLLAALLLLLPLSFGTPARAGDPPRVSDTEAYRLIGQEATVCGRVADSAWLERVKGNPTFLNMGAPYPGQTFTVVIWGDARAKFATPPHRLFAGADICVTGRIDMYKGKPQIVVRDPGQIVSGAPSFQAERFSYEERVVLKAVLAGLGFPSDEATGDWDTEAEQALTAFQKSVNLAADGRRGPSTLRGLAEAVDRLSEADKTRILKLWLLNLAQREGRAPGEKSATTGR